MQLGDSTKTIKDYHIRILTFQFIFIMYFDKTLSRSVEASVTSVTANFDEERLFRYCGKFADSMYRLYC